MAAGQLVGDAVADVREIEATLLARDARLEDHLKEQIAELLAVILVVAALDRLDHLVRFFEQIGRQRAQRLLSVPRATIGAAQLVHDAKKARTGLLGARERIVRVRGHGRRIYHARSGVRCARPIVEWSERSWPARVRRVIDLRGHARARACTIGLSLALVAGAVGAAPVPQVKSGATALGAGDNGIDDAESALGAMRFGLTLPQEKFDQIAVHWALRLGYLRDRDERRADDEEQRIGQLKDELAIDNLFTISAALIHEADGALAAGSNSLALSRCARAIAFAPDFAEAHLCQARASFSFEPASLRAALHSAGEAASAVTRDARAASALRVNLGAILLLGLLIASALFTLLLFVRYASLYFHDVHHLFPNGARTWQTNVLAAALLLLPLLVELGPVPMFCTLLLACTLYASARELGVGVVILLGVAASPFAVQRIAGDLSFAGPAADLWNVERGEGSAAALARLSNRLEQSTPEFPVSFALARRAKREGDLLTAERLYTRALEATGLSSESLAAAHNNLGNVELLLGAADKATAQYSQAIELQDGFAEAHFNLSRALGIGGVEALERVQAEQTRALALDRATVEAFTGGQLQVNRKANRFVMDVRLPASSLRALEDAEFLRAQPVIELSRTLSGGFTRMELAPILPLLGALLLIALHRMGAALRPCARCEKCGREVCKRCDVDARPSEALCAQCVNVFIRRSNVEPIERGRKEAAVARFRWRRKLLLRGAAILSGAPQILMGRPLFGACLLVLTGIVCANFVLLRGLVHDPSIINSGLALARVGITAPLVVLLYLVGLRDLLAHQRAEE